MLTLKSGNALRSAFTRAFTPSLPEGTPGGSWEWSTTSAEITWSITSTRPWLNASSAMRASIALFCSDILFPPLSSLASPYLALRANGLLRGFRHDAELAQYARNVVLATLLDDLATLVEPCEGSALQLNAAVRRRKILARDRKSTRLNSSHRCISYAVFCLK